MRQLEKVGGDAGWVIYHRQDRALSLELQLVDADDAVIAIGLAERAAVIDDVPLARLGACSTE